MSLQKRGSWNKSKRNKKINEKMNNGRKEGRRKWKKNVKYGELQKTRKKLYIRANCCEVREDATETTLPICLKEVIRAWISFHRRGEWGRGEGIPVRNPIRIGCERGERGPMAFFWKIAGDPGIFVPPLSPYSKRRTLVLSLLLLTARTESYIRTRARG